MTERPDSLHSSLDAMTGRRLPGGCDDCDAYQVMSQCADGLYVLTVHHDETCPALADNERTSR
jgi:hypothetical protein